MTTLYKNIQTIREKRNIKSIRQLEKCADVPMDTIKRWKEKSSSAIDALVKLSTFLNCSVDELVNEPTEQKNLDKIIFELEKHQIDGASASLIIDMVRAIMIKRNTNDDK